MQHYHEKLNCLHLQGIITLVFHSVLAAFIEVIKKANGTTRICADVSTGLNAVLEWYHYPLLVRADSFTMINGGKFFAKLDLADAWKQLKN